MKNLKLLATITLLLSSGLFISCSKDSEDPPTLLESEAVPKIELTKQTETENVFMSTPTSNPEGQLEQIFSDIAALGEAEGKVVTFDLVFEWSTNSFQSENIILHEVEPWLLDFEDEYGYEPEGSTITITCTFADGTSDSITCKFKDTLCVTVAIYGCMNDGGCATVCKTEPAYVPAY